MRIRFAASILTTHLDSCRGKLERRFCPRLFREFGGGNIRIKLANSLKRIEYFDVGGPFGCNCVQLNLPL
jgi:hypothetical protein